MGCKGICRFFFRRLLEILVVLLIILFLPNLPPYSKFSESISTPIFKPLEGKLSTNNRLSGAEIWHGNELNGPEAFADYNGELYTSLLGGDIVKLVGNHITPVVRTGKPCSSSYQDQICGRPLGLKFDKHGNLYVADAYYGILKINVKTGQKEVLVNPNQEIAGRRPMIFNSIALASNGDIYWTDSSSDFQLHNGLITAFADPSGRLIHYDAKTKTNRVLIDNLHFANGVMLSYDESFIIVAETFRSRIHRYYLAGPKKGTQNIFIDGLPGLLDNINSDGRGGFLIPLVISADADHPYIGQIIQPFPLLKKLLARLIGITDLMLETINRIYPSEFAERSIHLVGHFQMFPKFFDPPRTTIVRVSNEGEIIESLSTTDSNVHSISEAHIFKDHLYLGSPFNSHIVRIPLSKIGWSDLAQTKERRNIPEIPQTTPLPRQQPSTPSPEQTTTESRRPTQQTAPPKRQTTPSPEKTPPPQKQQTTTPPPEQQSTTPPKQQTTPSKPQTTPPKQATTPPKKAPPPQEQQTTTPLPKQQTTMPPKKQTLPPQKQETKTPQQTQQNLPPKQQATVAPSKQQATMPSPAQKITTPSQQQATTPPPRKETSTVKPQATTSAQQAREHVKAVPVKDTPRAKNS